ncbi:nitrous oxide reductase accessory protein NosL [Muricauda sp. 2012CJ35-5]|uniref:Nitrous oxide reductase accessory protein NosL n=1 Tax=Flagellimonas spongiicola TaxID=2942208 RepID=A0ABT0PW56_9FLAO|nr:nitrous oxide reductase accessory protein NosL [Allomuricauda spongiicola]MCL6275599.1 nitrous oxide reductase accessory protein NosL [Allomuricauda spongiicola]
MSLNRIGKYAIVTCFLVLTACSPRPKEIVYGTDGCHFCRMTIVDAQHAAQLVTKKGKAYKFDAIECMINHLKEVDTSEVAVLVCNHYSKPKELIDATQATFLVSESIPSPMGEFLTAFKERKEAENILKDNPGNLYNWQQIVEVLNH